jgi:fatty acid desaturase
MPGALPKHLGHLGMIAATGALSWYASIHFTWPLLPAWPVFTWHRLRLLLNAFHEFCHNTVFETRAINRFFLLFVSFIGGFNHVYFWASHQEHHKYTLHQPDDMEVILPIEITLKSFLMMAIINPQGVFERYKKLDPTKPRSIRKRLATHALP